MRDVAFIVALLMICALLIALTKTQNMVNDLEKELKNVQSLNNYKIEQLGREIRLLKTDVDITKYGFEDKTLDK